MNDLPTGWEGTTLGEIAETSLGKMLDRGTFTGSNAVPYLRNINVQWGRFELEDILTIEIPPEQQSFFELRPGDLMVCEGGEIGRCAVWPGSKTYMAFQKALHRVRPYPGVDARFLRYLLEHYSHANALVPYSTGSTIKHLPQQQLRRLPLPLPPLAEQRRITAFLDEQLPHLEAGARSLEDIGRAVGALWNAVLDGIYRAELLNERTPNLSPLVELAEIEGGIQKQPKRRPVVNKYPFLRVANVSRGSLDLGEVHEIELFGAELERYSLRAGDLLVVEGNGSPAQIGRAAMWHGEIKNCVHQNHLIRVRPGRNLDGRFLEMIWNSPPTVRQLREIASSTSGLHTLSTGKLKALKIPAPPLDSQLDLVASAEEWKMRIQRLGEALLRSSTRTKQLSRVLLADVFAGRLVPQDPNDEPVSVLLERIKVERAAQPKAKRARRTPKNPNPEQESLL